MKRKIIVWGIALGFLVIGFVLLNTLPYSKLPVFKETETILKIDWNENLNVTENSKRIVNLFNEIERSGLHTYISETGEQDFLLQKEQVQTFSEAIIYVEAKSPSKLEKIKRSISDKLISYPTVAYSFNPPKTIFDFLFGSKQAELTAQVFSRTSLQVPPENRLHEVETNLKEHFSTIILNQTSSIIIQQDRLALYNIDYFTVVAELKAAFDQNFIDNLKASERFIPIKINYEQTQLEDKLTSLFITNNEGNTIAVKNLITIQPTSHYKTIYADKTGEFLKFDTESDSSSSIEIINSTQENFKNNTEYGVRFTGSWFEFENLGNELIFVLIIAILLLYFIMAAQFESLKQPLIILMELPIALGGSLTLLWFFSGSINVMSFIGIVVMSGIIINDSIIKIHTINLLRKQGYTPEKAVLEGGKLRLKPIVMTSLTTILALVPFLFISGLGADLQKPLALVVIGGLALGTFISLYFLPLFYLSLENNKSIRTLHPH
jgi:multidrug efflux pump subunit AcrB